MPSAFTTESDLREAVTHDAARRTVEPIPLLNRVPDRDVGSAEIQKLREVRRAQFAGQIHAALVHHAGFNVAPDTVASMAVRHADALLLELEKRR